jgi:hypothetical protein
MRHRDVRGRWLLDGRWERDTLVVQTTHLRGEDPARFAIPRPLLVGRHSRITERFTRVSETELFYQFTIDEDELYTRPWRGEFSFRRHDGQAIGLRGCLLECRVRA